MSNEKSTKPGDTLVQDSVVDKLTSRSRAILEFRCCVGMAWAKRPGGQMEVIRQPDAE